MGWIYLRLLYIAIINPIWGVSSIGSYYEIIKYEQENEDDQSAITQEMFECNLESTCNFLAARSSEALSFHNDEHFLGVETSAMRKISAMWFSCKEALKTNGKKEGIYKILSHGMEQPIKVNCTFTGNTITSAIHHDTEDMNMKNGYESARSYRRKIKYTSNLKDVIKFVEASSVCRQFTRIDCYKVRLSAYAALYDRSGKQISYFGGGPTDGTGCECGKTGSCHQSSAKCNCDSNDGVWRFDEGFVYDKKLLPLTEIRYGDTGSSYEKGRYKIGPIVCVESWV